MWLEEIYTSMDNLVLWIFVGVSALILVLNFTQVVITFCSKSQFRSGISIEVFIAMGGMLLAASVIMRGLASEFDIDEELLCDMFPSILCIGLTEFIGGLFVKSLTLFLYEHILINRKAKYEEWKANLWMLILSLISAVAIIIWCIKYTPYVDTSLGIDLQCTSDRWYEWKLIASLYHTFLLICAMISGFACLKVGTAYAIMTSLSIINTCLCSIAGVVVYYAYTGSPTATYAITGGLMLWAVLFNCVAGIVSKCCNSRNYSRPRRDSIEVPIGGDTYDTINSDKIKTSEPLGDDGFNDLY